MDDARDFVPDLCLYAQLLLEFAAQSVSWLFAVLNFASGEFSASRIRAATTLFMGEDGSKPGCGLVQPHIENSFQTLSYRGGAVLHQFTILFLEGGREVTVNV
jgi:hypothetical protein